MTDKKKKIRKPNFRQKLFIKKLAKGGSAAEAARAAGYSDNIARNPQKIVRTESFIDIMNRYGLDDDSIARAHHDLVHATVVRDRRFDASIRKVVSKLKGDKKAKRRYVRTPIDDEVIRATIEAGGSCELVSIIDYGDHKIAYYTAPERVAKKGGVELAFKAKGHMAPEKHDHGIFHEPTEEERKLIGSIINSNQKK